MKEVVKAKQRRLWKGWMIFSVVLGTISLIALLISRNSAAFSDWYAKTIYPAFTALVSGLFGWLPFSAAEMGLLLTLPLLACLGLLWLIGRLKGKRKPGGWKRGLAFLLSIVCLLFSQYTFLCGIQYGRSPVFHRISLSKEEAAPQMVGEMYSQLIERLNLLAPQLQRSASGQYREHQGFSARAAQAKEVMEQLGKEYPPLELQVFGPPKGVIASPLMSKLQLTGIYSPFTSEANINTHAPAITLPATLLHEQAHQRGVMREEEANFVAILGCAASHDPVFQYSGYLLALNYTENALWQVDAEDCKRRAKALSPLVWTDREAVADYWKEQEGWLSHLSAQTNEIYLQSNQQSSGIKSYGLVVELLLASFQQGTAPF